MPSPSVAVIDIGSNTIKLLVAAHAPAGQLCLQRVDPPLEVGQRKGNVLPGKITFCVPGEKATIAGSFEAVMRK